MTQASERIVICGAGIAGIAAAYYLAVEHGRRNVVVVEEGHPLSLTSDKSNEAFEERKLAVCLDLATLSLTELLPQACGSRIRGSRSPVLVAQLAL